MNDYNPIWIQVVDALPDIGLTPFAQAMPDYCRNDNAVIAYRQYYMREKKHIAKWKSKKPAWFTVVV